MFFHSKKCHRMPWCKVPLGTIFLKQWSTYGTRSCRDIGNWSTHFLIFFWYVAFQPRDEQWAYFVFLFCVSSCKACPLPIKISEDIKADHPDVLARWLYLASVEMPKQEEVRHDKLNFAVWDTTSTGFRWCLLVERHLWPCSLGENKLWHAVCYACVMQKSIFWLCTRFSLDVLFYNHCHCSSRRTIIA